jgi:hypothetical protein
LPEDHSQHLFNKLLKTLNRRMFPYCSRHVKGLAGGPVFLRLVRCGNASRGGEYGCCVLRRSRLLDERIGGFSSAQAESIDDNTGDHSIQGGAECEPDSRAHASVIITEKTAMTSGATLLLIGLVSTIDASGTFPIPLRHERFTPCGSLKAQF